MDLGGDTPPAFCVVNNERIFELSVHDLTSTLWVNIFVFVALLLFFEFMRHKDSIYFCRKLASGSVLSPSRLPPALPRGLFQWVAPIMSMPRHRILFYAGLDAYMLIRFLRLCLQVCVVSASLGLGILVPLYIRGHRISMSNLKPESQVLWVPVLIAYVSSIHVLYLLNKEFMKFLELRIAFQALGDPDVNPQKSFSVQVERIPFEYRTNLALYSFFDELFPNQVHSAVVSLDVEELEVLVDQRRQILSDLEMALAMRAITGREPTKWVGRDDTWKSWVLWRGCRVGAVGYYEKKLDEMNRMVLEMQAAIRSVAEAINNEEKQHLAASRGNSWKSTHNQLSRFLVGDPETRARLLEMEYIQRQQEIRKQLEQEAKGPTRDGVAGRGHHRSRDRYSKRRESQSMLDVVVDLTMGAINAGARTGMAALKGAKQVTKAMTLLTLGTTMSSTGFVTFRSLTTSSMAAQALLTTQPFVFDVHPAPEPRDIIWQNVAVPTTQINLRQTITEGLLLFFSIFWGSFILLIYSVNHVIKRIPFLEDPGPQGNPVHRLFSTLIADYLPALLLLCTLQLLPWIFYYISYRYERLKTHSDVQASILSRYFYYQMINIFATVVGGGIVTEFALLVENPRSVVRILGCTMPNVSVYFIQIIITYSFTANILEFARVVPMVRMWATQNLPRLFWSWLFASEHIRAHREKRDSNNYSPPRLMFGWTYPSILLVLTICLTYSVIMPLTLVFGAVFFFFAEVIYTYQVCYIYVPQYESGGKLWYNVFDRTLIALGLSQLTLIGYLLNNGASLHAAALLPLPISLIPYYHMCRGGYYQSSLKLSLLAARRVDRDLAKDENMKSPMTPSAVQDEDWRVAVSEEGSAAGDDNSTPEVVDYFQVSAYAQPSLTDGPCRPERFEWRGYESISTSQLSAEEEGVEFSEAPEAKQRFLNPSSLRSHYRTPSYGTVNNV